MFCMQTCPNFCYSVVTPIVKPPVTLCYQNGSRRYWNLPSVAVRQALCWYTCSCNFLDIFIQKLTVLHNCCFLKLCILYVDQSGKPHLFSSTIDNHKKSISVRKWVVAYSSHWSICCINSWTNAEWMYAPSSFQLGFEAMAWKFVCLFEFILSEKQGSNNSSYRNSTPYTHCNILQRHSVYYSRVIRWPLSVHLYM
jgi:hypothetical protein